mmetsp:Transcript_9122/g.22352  ORF Transcript_9122/g.22352 Transcript_9122/m.22352 type:complete len:212 (-) Transcript_9122:213-848(-)
MMMISKQSAHSQYCIETTQSIDISSKMQHVSTFGAHLQTYPPCPPAAPPLMKMRKPEDSPKEQSSKKKRRCGTVGFKHATNLFYIESAFEFTQDEKDDRWYRNTEIASFKDSARKLCRSMLESAKSGKDESSEDDEQQRSGEQRESTRGLEAYNPSRQRFSKRFTQHVLEAYYVRCVGNIEHVALLAEKWSKKSLARAIATGEKDFSAAYA